MFPQILHWQHLVGGLDMIISKFVQVLVDKNLAKPHRFVER